jgi:hypothetical protein
VFGAARQVSRSIHLPSPCRGGAFQRAHIPRPTAWPQPTRLREPMGARGQALAVWGAVPPRAAPRPPCRRRRSGSPGR